ncbi:hypothetical protein ACF8O8_25675 [Pseudomonas sp. TYF_14]|uniref:hypothetical protein n=1 Tax=Pseudomonas sp. TYF_14 TaxID=3367193 RepID=UPI00370BA347
MSRTNTQTHELRHPDTGHTVFADFGSRSLAHFLSLGYSYPEAEPAVQAAETAKPTRRSKPKPVVKEAVNGDDNP